MKKLAMTAILLMSLCRIVVSDSIIRHPDLNRPLADRWNWALKDASRQVPGKGYWILWSFQRQMPENELVGSFYADGKQRTSLMELITGNKSVTSVTSVQEEAKKALIRIDEPQRGRVRIITRDVGILVEVSPQGELQSSAVNMLHLYFNTKHKPVVWLGESDMQQSFHLVEQLYAQNKSTDFKSEMIVAAALHPLLDRVVPFLEKIFMEEKSVELRGQAAFWLGNQGGPEAVKVLTDQLPKERSEDVVSQAMAGLQDSEGSVDIFYRFAAHGNSRLLREQAIFWLGQTESDKAAGMLKNIIADDPDLEVQKKAVFSLSQMPENLSLAAMIEIARKNKSEELRKETVFWLSQIASKKVVDVLKDTVEHDENYEIQKQAVFALSELEDNAGVEELIHVAKTHPNPQLRKEAIFWLGECDDPRAREALLKMLEE